MPLIRTWSATAAGVTVNFECPYYAELLPSENPETGRLSRDLECHALWQYYGLALYQYNRAKSNLVEESELSLHFTSKDARELFLSVAKNHNVRPDQMVKFWDVVNRQRLALGSGDDLPSELKFRFWGN